MPTVERTVTTPTPLDRVWAYLSDFTTVAEWDPNTPDSRLVEGEGEVGSKYAITSVFRKRTTHLEYVVTEREPLEHFALDGENRTVSVVEDMRFAATPEGGTRVTYRAEFTFHGAAKLAAPFLGGALTGIADDAERGMQKALDALG